MRSSRWDDVTTPWMKRSRSGHRSLTQLTAQAAPELLERFGVGPEVAAQLLVTAGDNPDRPRSEAY